MYTTSVFYKQIYPSLLHHRQFPNLGRCITNIHAFVRLTELPFPRDSTLCTRFATQINFRRADQDTVSISIIPSTTSEAARKAKLKEFREDESKAFTRERFASILSKVRHRPTQRLKM
jgi:hypothetical protein